ncbi:M15 family metallopeptidase [Viridibacterium curvum]
MSTTRRYRWWLLAAFLIVSLPVVLIIALRDEISLQGYSETARQQDSVVSTLLAGEQLVPPPTLPPEVFSTREVLAERPSLASASRDWKLLDQDFEQRLLRVFQRMREQGYEMALLEGYRSPERQNQLASQGSHVTNARAFQSYHQFGLAADCAFLRDGKLVISERDPWAMRGYELYGQAAEAFGLTWGGRWKMMDLGHVELRRAKGITAPTN